VDGLDLVVDLAPLGQVNLGGMRPQFGEVRPDRGEIRRLLRENQREDVRLPNRLVDSD
jgi:hypothetical protein